MHAGYVETPSQRTDRVARDDHSDRLVALILMCFNRLSQAGRTPESHRDGIVATAGAVGMFLLYGSMLVALTAGGIGLLWRKPWGYYWHLAGAGLAALSIVGIVYTIRAILIALQPEIRDYCLGFSKAAGNSALLDEV